MCKRSAVVLSPKTHRGGVTDNPPRPLQGHEVPAEPLRPRCRPCIYSATRLTPSSGGAGHLLLKTFFLVSLRFACRHAVNR